MVYIHKRAFYVKLSNIYIKNQNINHIKMIMASSGPELLKKSIKEFGFHEDSIKYIKLLSSDVVGSSKTLRLDKMEYIPDRYEFVWLYAS